MPPKRRSLRETLRDRVRLTLLVGLGLLLVGAVLPWMRVWLPYEGFFDVTGFERAGDAGLLLEFGVVGLVLTWSERAWHSRVTVLVAGPFLLAVASVALLRVAHGDANIYLDSLAPRGGNGSILWPFWAANAGAVLASIAGAAHLWQARSRLSFDIGLTVPAVAGTVGGVAGAVLGFVMGTTIAERLAAGAIAGAERGPAAVRAIGCCRTSGRLCRPRSTKSPRRDSVAGSVREGRAVA